MNKYLILIIIFLICFGTYSSLMAQDFPQSEDFPQLEDFSQLKERTIFKKIIEIAENIQQKVANWWEEKAPPKIKDWWEREKSLIKEEFEKEMKEMKEDLKNNVLKLVSKYWQSLKELIDFPQ